MKFKHHFGDNLKERFMLLDMNDIPDAKSLGARLREARKRAGFTQSDVADRLRVTTQAVSQWETGANQITIEKKPIFNYA